MEAVFYRLHVRCVRSITRVLPARARRWVEAASLFHAFLLLGVLVHLHRLHVARSPLRLRRRVLGESHTYGTPGPGSCLAAALSNAKVDASHVHVLQIHISPSRVPQSAPSAGSRFRQGQPQQQQEPLAFLSMDQGKGKDALGTPSGPGTLGLSSTVLADGEEQPPQQQQQQQQQSPNSSMSWWQKWNALPVGSSALASTPKMAADLLESIGSGGESVYLYSLEKGFLMLRQELREQHGIVAANVTVSMEDECLGDGVSRGLLRQFVGYDTIVMNWLISLYRGQGFLYSVHNKELFNLNYASDFLASTEDVYKFLAFKAGVLFTTLFLFFTTTSLVSFTLRETQERMLKFTYLLQHHVRNRMPYAPLVLTHVVESLVFVPIMVGVLFFLFEFFSDQLLAFMVLSVVWLCEVYSVISMRTTMCTRFFPRVFFLYFTLFHIYFFSFPFGFSYLALATTVLFLQHSMLFFWNRYEVPALESGAVSSARPRMSGVMSVRPSVRHGAGHAGLGLGGVSVGASTSVSSPLRSARLPPPAPVAPAPSRPHLGSGGSNASITLRSGSMHSSNGGGGSVSGSLLEGAGVSPGNSVGSLQAPASGAQPPAMSRVLSAPLLGSFPLTHWNVISASGAAAATEAAPGGGAPRPVAAAAAPPPQQQAPNVFLSNSSSQRERNQREEEEEMLHEYQNSFASLDSDEDESSVWSELPGGTSSSRLRFRRTRFDT